MPTPDPSTPPVNLDDFEFGQTLRAHQGGDKAFGRFAMKRKLGQGGMGVVWLAEDTLLRNREVALKFAPPNIRDDDSAIEELKQETLSGQALAHPNIVRIYDFFIDEESAAICMEYVDGETLARLRTRQPGKIFEPRQVTRWVAQLLDGLSYAHRTGRLVHRDLKPPNLIINTQGDLKIMDFGIARSIQDAITRVTNVGSSTGTLAYMSPQQAAGQHAGPEDDVYSLGCTLYELFTGKPPFYTGDIGRQLRDSLPPTVTQRRMEFGITTAEPMPAVWEEVIMRCLSKQPEQRPASVDEVRSLLGLGSTSNTPELTPVLGAHSSADPMAASMPTAVTQSAAGGRSVTLRASMALEPLLIDTQNRSTQAATRSRDTQSASIDRAALATESQKTFGKIPAWVWIVISLTVVAIAAAVLLSGGGNNLDTAKDATKSSKSPDVVQQQEESGAKNTPPVNPPSNTASTSPQTGSASKSMATTTPDKSLGLLVPDAYKTFAEAMAAAKSGDTVKIKGGTYEEPLHMVDGVSVAAATPGEQVLISVSGAQGAALEAERIKTAVSITGITFSHAEGDQTDPSGALATAAVLSSRIEFIDCVFEAGLGSGLRVEGASQVTLTRCFVHKNSSEGVIVSRGARMTMNDTRVNANGADGIKLSGTGSTVELQKVEVTRNLRNGVMIEQGAKLTGHAVIASENTYNGIHAADEDSTTDLDGGECNRNGFSFLGKDSKSTLSNLGGAGLVAEAGARLAVTGMQISGNARDGINMSDCASGTRLTGCTLTSNARNAILALCTMHPTVEMTNNRCVGSERGIALDGTDFAPRLSGNHFENLLVGVFMTPGTRPEMNGSTFNNVRTEVQYAQP